MQVRFLSAACILHDESFMKAKKKNISFKEKLRSFLAAAGDMLTYLKDLIVDYGRIILPVILLVCIAITLYIALSARSRVEAARQDAEEALIESKTEVNEVKEINFELNAIPEVNELITRYYEAIKAVDTDALAEIQGSLSDTEALRLEAMAPYIDRYENINVYTKPGPYQDTYIAYATVDVYLKEQEPSTPGIQSFYICKTEDGLYYINNGEISAEEAAYIEDVTAQADVVDLKNTVHVAYNEQLEADEELKAYWAQISVEIDSSVGEQLTNEAIIQAKLAEEEKQRQLEEQMNDPNYVPPEEPEVQKVKVNTLVNVRKSASATADKVGTASVGSIYEVLEVMQNGWTRINYDGTQAYIKSEFLDQIANLDNIATIGILKTLDMLNVRSEPNQNATKLGVLNSGVEIELVEEVGEWSKIKYDGQLGYVKTEYTEKIE